MTGAKGSIADPQNRNPGTGSLSGGDILLTGKKDNRSERNLIFKFRAKAG